MQNFDVVIVGAGIMGAATAFECSRRGARVALVDQAVLPNAGGASIDHSRVFRFAYPDQVYARMARQSLELWRRLEQESGERLLTECGLLMIGHQEPSVETATYTILRSLNLEAEKLSSAEAAARFPQFDETSFRYAVFDPSGAILHAERAVSAILELARKSGATIIEGERVKAVSAQEPPKIFLESGTVLECGRALIAAGAWTRKLVPELADTLATTRQEVIYFEPRPGPSKFDPASFPIFIDLDSGFYGFPIHRDGAVKIANHNKGEWADPDLRDNVVGRYAVSECRAFFAAMIPDLTTARTVETRVCFYNNTPDDDFIIDWRPSCPNVLIATGFSGHGFKFGPLVGRICAELLLDGSTDYEVDRFTFERLSLS